MLKFQLVFRSGIALAAFIFDESASTSSLRIRFNGKKKHRRRRKKGLDHRFVFRPRATKTARETLSCRPHHWNLAVRRQQADFLRIFRGRLEVPPDWLLTSQTRLRNRSMPHLKVRRKQTHLLTAYKIFTWKVDIPASLFFCQPSRRGLRRLISTVVLPRFMCKRRKHCFATRVSPIWKQRPANRVAANYVSVDERKTDPLFFPWPP